MAGREVFKFATRVVDDSIRQAVSLAGIEMKDVSLVVPHQANQRILASAAKKLGLDIEMFVSNLDRYGNTSAASIPIALCEAIEGNRVKTDDYLVFVGFGGGLSWASMVIKWLPDAVRVEPGALNQQRREFQYTWARWRSRIQRWQRAISRFFGRFSS